MVGLLLLLGWLFILLVSSCAPIPTATPAPVETGTQAIVLNVPPTNTPPPLTPIITQFPPTPSVTVVPQASPTATPTRRLALKNLRKTDFLPPAVQALAPGNSNAVSQFELVPLTILAADDSGIARVEVFDNNSLAAMVNILAPEPKTFSTIVFWSAAQLGTHIVRVVAFDTQENASQPVELAFVAVTDNRRPYVVITSPLGPQQVEIGTPLTVQGFATDDVGVTRVDLIVDNELVTFHTSSRQSGDTTFVVAFTYVPRKAGSHTLILRAYDNQGQTSDSNNIGVLVGDIHTPGIAVNFDRDSLAPNEPVIISALAISQAGIARMELLVDDFIVQTVISQSPASQTSFHTQMVWSNEMPGTHLFQVRAVDQFGLNSASVLHSVRVREPKESTPIPTARVIATITPIPPPTRPGGTPTLAPPKAPSIELTSPADKSSFILGTALRLVASAHGDGELDRVEIWGAYQGEPDGFLITTASARGNTGKTLSFDWTPPSAGVVRFYARAFDIYGQAAQSQTFTVFLEAAPGATPASSGLTINGRWRSELATGTFS
ncbi:MAG TPA: Ig-like domain-containing protein, partial [Anaerolineae bacterium]